MAFEQLIPLKSARFYHSDLTWMSVSIKKLINDRQKAFYSGNVLQKRTLKYKVQIEIALRKKEYYKNKVQHLKKDDCRKWCQVDNRMSGQSLKGTKFIFEKDVYYYWIWNWPSLNTFYISVNADIPLLDMTTLPAYLSAADQVPTIEPYKVCKKLLAINTFKSCGPYDVPGRLWKKVALLFAEPVANIFNTSLLFRIVHVFIMGCIISAMIVSGMHALDMHE